MFLALAAFLSGWVGLAVLVVYAFVIGALFEDDWWFRGFLFLAIPFGVAYGVGVVGIPDWTALSIYVGAYFVAGVVWSFFKWILFCSDLKKDLQEYIKSNPSNSFGIGTGSKTITWNEMTREQKGETLWEHLRYGNYRAFLEQKEVEENLNVTPHLSTWTNKARVFSWIAYWPFSVVNYVFDRLLRDLIDWVIESLKGVYNVIAANIMKGLQI